MKSNIEQYTVQFHNRAREIFFSLYNDFKRSTATVDRLRDENVFQQLQAKYTHELKSQLYAVASEMLEQVSSGVHDGFNHLLHSLIEDYINEFVQKARSL